MHECPECGKKMATAGGLEIHEQLAHGAGRAEPVVDADQVFEVGDVPRRERDPRAVVPMERQRSRPASNRTAVPFIAMAIVALLIAGVASALVHRDTSEATPLAIVQASASATTGAHTTQISVSISGGSGLFKSFSETGGFDFDARRFRIQIDMSKLGISGIGNVDAIADYSTGLIEYVHLPAQIADEAGGKPWIKVDLQALFKQLGIDANLGALIQGQSGDPTQGLNMVRGAENVVRVGSDQVRGVDTTHYHLDINYQKAVQEQPTPEAHAAMQQLVSYYTVPTQPFDVWVDSDGRIRRTQQTLDLSTVRLPSSLASKVKQAGTSTFTEEFYGFGNPVDTKLPSPDQVTDFNQLTR